MNTNDGNGDENNDDNDYGNDDDTSAMVPKNLTLPVWCDLKNV